MLLHPQPLRNRNAHADPVSVRTMASTTAAYEQSADRAGSECPQAGGRCRHWNFANRRSWLQSSINRWTALNKYIICIFLFSGSSGSRSAIAATTSVATSAS